MTRTAGTCLLAVRQASFRRHDLYPGLITEPGNLSCNDKGNAQREQPEGRIPTCRNRDGPTRSSDEVPVTGVDRVPPKALAVAQQRALESVRNSCRRTDWVIDLDIKGFFDNIDHGKLLLALEKHVSENWCLFYIKRWLNAPVLKKSGELVQKQGKGTPQGGVISPLLANLFLHYAMDKWLELKHPEVKFARYADDAILHCRSKTHVEQTLNAVRERMKECGLELHPEKTKLVYCKDYRRRYNYPVVKFDFLGYSFQPRTTKSRKTGKLFLGYDCAISISSKKRIADKMEELKIVGLTHKSIVGVAQFLNPYIRGWGNYYSKFRKSAMNPIFQWLNKRLIRWVRKRYKRYKTSIKRAFRWFTTVREQFPGLFYHWQIGLC